MGLGFLIVEYSGSHSVSPHSVGLFWASEQLITEDATNAIKQTQETNIQAPYGIRTRKPSKPAVADPRFRPRDHRD